MDECKPLAGGMEGHDVPPDVLTAVVYWLRAGGEEYPFVRLNEFRRNALEGGKYCHNDGCEVVGHLKDFNVCPLCKVARYCGATLNAPPTPQKALKLS